MHIKSRRYCADRKYSSYGIFHAYNSAFKRDAFIESSNNLCTILFNREISEHSKPTFEQRYKYEFSKRFLPNQPETLRKCASKVFVCQYARDGNVLVSASQDQHIRIFDSSNYHYKLINTLSARDVGWSILDVVVSPDGRHLIYSSWSEKVHQCKLDGDPESHVSFDLSPDEQRFCCFCLRFSPDFHGAEILAGANDCRIYVYNREINRRILRVKAHEDDVNAVCFAGHTADIFYTGSDDGLVKVWDRRTLIEDNPKPVAIFAGHADGITFIDSKGDARYCISNSKDQSIKLWDVRRPSSREGIAEALSVVSEQSWDYRWQNVSRLRRNKRINGDSSVKTYGGSHHILHTLIRCFFSPQFSTGQQMIYTGCALGSCVVYDSETGETVTKLTGHKACVRDVTWHPYHNEICTSSWDSRTVRWTYREQVERSTDRIESESEVFYFSSDEDLLS